MGVTGIFSCYFTVWTVKAIFVQIVEFDEQLWNKVNTNLKLFYKSFVCPALPEFKPITYCGNCDTVLLENSEMDMFINIRHNCAFQEKLKKVFFVNNFCVPELYTLKFLIQKETMPMQISAASPSADFHSGRNYVKKITMFTF